MSLELGIKNLYTNNRTKIFSMVLKNNGTYDDASDILQEGVITVWNNFKANNDFRFELHIRHVFICGL